MGILFDIFLDYIKKRVETQSEKTQYDFVDSLMKIFEVKIFPIHKLNFMQYVPFYIMTLESSKNTISKIFAEKLMSFLIVKTFNCLQREHLSIRQQAWNYLASLVSKQNSILKSATLVKCMNLVLRFYESN